VKIDKFCPRWWCFPLTQDLLCLSGVGHSVPLDCVGAYLSGVARSVTHRRDFRSKGYNILLKCSIWDTNLIHLPWMVVFPTSGVPLRFFDFDSTMLTMVSDCQPAGHTPGSDLVTIGRMGSQRCEFAFVKLAPNGSQTFHDLEDCVPKSWIDCLQRLKSSSW
jgi:hypothetical protein